VYTVCEWCVDELLVVLFIFCFSCSLFLLDLVLRNLHSYFPLVRLLGLLVDPTFSSPRLIQWSLWWFSKSAIMQTLFVLVFSRLTYDKAPVRLFLGPAGFSVSSCSSWTFPLLLMLFRVILLSDVSSLRRNPPLPFLFPLPLIGSRSSGLT